MKKDNLLFLSFLIFTLFDLFSLKHILHLIIAIPVLYFYKFLCIDYYHIDVH